MNTLRFVYLFYKLQENIILFGSVLRHRQSKDTAVYDANISF